MSEPYPFPRTECSCRDCTSCCEQQPGFLVPGDVPRLRLLLGAPERSEGSYLAASPGALVGVVGPGGAMVTYRVGTIVPRTVPGRGGRCLFLTEEGLCRVHAAAPFGCRAFDSHMGAEEAQLRSSWGVRQALDRDYQRLRELLPRATSYRPFRRS